MPRTGELSERKAAILRDLVRLYIRTGEPVGSEALAAASGLSVSSATVRNELAALEEMGYLTQPHTSAGRMPTDRGYRYFVDLLPARARLRDPERRAIVDFFDDALAVAGQCDDAAATARVTYHLGELARAGGALAEAASLHHKALTRRHEVGDRAGVAESLEALAAWRSAPSSSPTA